MKKLLDFLLVVAALFIGAIAVAQVSLHEALGPEDDSHESHQSDTDLVFRGRLMFDRSIDTEGLDVTAARTYVLARSAQEEELAQSAEWSQQRRMIRERFPDLDRIVRSPWLLHQVVVPDSAGYFEVAGLEEGVEFYLLSTVSLSGLVLCALERHTAQLRPIVHSQTVSLGSGEVGGSLEFRGAALDDARGAIRITNSPLQLLPFTTDTSGSFAIKGFPFSRKTVGFLDNGVSHPALDAFCLGEGSSSVLTWAPSLPVWNQGDDLYLQVNFFVVDSELAFSQIEFENLTDAPLEGAQVFRLHAPPSGVEPGLQRWLGRIASSQLSLKREDPLELGFQKFRLRDWMVRHLDRTARAIEVLVISREIQPNLEPRSDVFRVTATLPEALLLGNYNRSGRRDLTLTATIGEPQRVVQGNLTVRLIDDEGNPYSNRGVFLRFKDSEELDLPILEIASTDAEGWCVFQSLPADHSYEILLGSEEGVELYTIGYLTLRECTAGVARGLTPSEGVLKQEVTVVVGD